VAAISRRIANAAVLAFLLCVAEVMASFLCWSGTPADALPDPRFNFWYLEVWRLRYWAACFFCASLVWLIVRSCAEGRAGGGETNAQYSFKKLALWLLAIGLAVSAELGTSLWYQRRLPWILSFTMDATDLHLYLRDHLTGWTLVVSVGLVLWCLQKYKVRRRAGGTP